MTKDYRDFLRPADPDGLQRWRKEAEQREAELAQAKRARQRIERSASLDDLRAELQREVAALRNQIDASHECLIAATGEALGDLRGEFFAETKKAIDKIQTELFGLVERRFGELMGRLDGFLPERPRGKDFRFAGERDDGALDLPNPLRRRLLDS